MMLKQRKNGLLMLKNCNCKIKIEMGDIKWQIQQNALEYHIVL